MKGERRHELQQNELADWLNKVIEGVKPFSNVLMAGLLLLVVLGGLYVWWAQQDKQQQAGAWDLVWAGMDAQRPSEVQRVAEVHPDAAVGHRAALIAADQFRVRGAQELFRNRAAASEDLQKAMDNYLEVLAGSTKPAVREQATFGLARTYESLSGTRQSQGELKKALEKYEEVVKKWPNGVYAELAARRIEDLNRQETKVFYDEFARFEPEPIVAGWGDESGEGPTPEPGGLPDDGSLPDVSDVLGPPEDKPAESPPPEPKPPATPGEE